MIVGYVGHRDSVAALSSPGAQAVLIGTGEHLASSGLPDVSAVSTTLDDLKHVLVRQCGMVEAMCKSSSIR